MTAHTSNHEADGRAICSAIAEQSDDEEVQDYARHYTTDATLQMYASMAQHLFRVLENPRASSGLDYGCNCGLSTFYYQQETQGRVWGCDVSAEKVQVAEGWRQAMFPELPLRFIGSRPESVPLHSGSMDWIVLNAVLYCIHPDYWPATLGEVARLLKPGGWLFFADSNNPYCGDTIERLRLLFRRNEIGDGSPERPAGRLFRQREAILAGMAPDLDRETIGRLARDTCYLYGMQLNQALAGFRASARWPSSAFKPESLRSPCDPVTGVCKGNITDPFVIQRSLSEVGIDTTLCSGPVFSEPENAALDDFIRSSQGFYLIGRKR